MWPLKRIHARIVESYTETSDGRVAYRRTTYSREGHIVHYHAHFLTPEEASRLPAGIIQNK